MDNSPLAEKLADKSLLSEQAQRNLVELSTYLKAYALRMASDKKHKKGETKPISFDLESFFEDHPDFTRDDCGTSACAVGHFAIMRGYDASFEGVTLGDISMGWRTFSAKVVGVAPTGEQEAIWEWLFSGVWSEHDNTPLGVVARIEYFLEHGVPDGGGINEVFGMNIKKLLSTYLERREALERECGIA